MDALRRCDYARRYLTVATIGFIRRRQCRPQMLLLLLLLQRAPVRLSPAPAAAAARCDSNNSQPTAHSRIAFAILPFTKRTLSVIWDLGITFPLEMVCSCHDAYTCDILIACQNAVVRIQCILSLNRDSTRHYPRRSRSAIGVDIVLTLDVCMFVCLYVC